MCGEEARAFQVRLVLYTLSNLKIGFYHASISYFSLSCGAELVRLLLEENPVFIVRPLLFVFAVVKAHPYYLAI